MIEEPLRIVPLGITQANKLVERWHRHSKPLGFLTMYAVGLAQGKKIIGGAMVGRPISASYCDGYTVEVKRLVTDGTKNACSILYMACWRIAKEMGFKRMLTYTLESESGSSLRAVGWKLAGVTDGFSQNTKSWKDLKEELQGGPSSRVVTFKGKKRRWVIQTPDYEEGVKNKEPFYLPFEAEDLIHRSAPLVYPPVDDVVFEVEAPDKEEKKSVELDETF